MTKDQHKNPYASLIDTESIYQNAPSGYISILPEGAIIKSNYTVNELLGYSGDELLHMNISDLITRGGYIHYEMFFKPMVSINGNIKELNYELIKKDGNTFPALLNGNAVKDAAGKMVAVNIVITDITQRNSYEKELVRVKNSLLAEKQRFELLAAMSPQLIWTMNAKGELTYLNKQALSFFNTDQVIPSKAELMKIIHQKDQYTLLRSWLLAAKKNITSQCRIRLEFSPGKYEWHEIQFMPSQNLLSDIEWMGSGVNIDEHVRRNQLKDEFVHMASHELKTPVTILKTYLHLLQNAVLPEKAQHYVLKSVHTLKNLQFLISTLLNVSAINSGEFALDRSYFLLDELLEECAENMNNSNQTHVVRIQSTAYPVEVFADKERLTQVIQNLLSNAVKYSPDQKEVILAWSAAPGDAKIEISVQDFGMGIPKTEIKNIFNKYIRLSQHSDISGLGLGLYITQNIVLAHGSELVVKSEPGKGSTFSFLLPIRPLPNS